MQSSWLGMMRKKRINLTTLLAILLSIFICFMLFFDYFFFTDRPLPLVNLPYIKNISNSPSFLANIERFKEENLQGPIAVAVGKDGRVYVADTGNSRVVAYTHEGKPLFKFGEFGTLDGEFNFPYSIAVDQNNLLYVGQFKAPRIQVFDAAGKFLRRIDKSTAGVPVVPLALAFDKQGLLYVANQDGKILVLTPDGKLVRSFGGTGPAEGNLSYPKGIAVDDTRVYVSDTNNVRVQIFTNDGKLVRVIKGSELKIQMASGIALGPGGTVLLVDTFSNRLNVYDKDFLLLHTLGERGSGEGQFNFPVGIAVDQYGKIFIGDSANNRVVVFQR